MRALCRCLSTRLEWPRPNHPNQATLPIQTAHLPSPMAHQCLPAPSPKHGKCTSRNHWHQCVAASFLAGAQWRRWVQKLFEKKANSPKHFGIMCSTLLTDRVLCLQAPLGSHYKKTYKKTWSDTTETYDLATSQLYLKGTTLPRKRLLCLCNFHSLLTFVQSSFDDICWV